MIRWFLVTLAWRQDGLTLNGVDTYSSREACDSMGHLNVLGDGWQLPS